MIERVCVVGAGVIGSLYALVGMGLILVYRANRIINFAQAQLGAVPAVIALLLIARKGWPWFAVLPIVVIGLTLANTIKPGTRINPSTAAALQERYATDATKTVEAAKQASTTSKPLMSVVETIVPKNPFFAVSGKEDANMLHLMFFGLIIGIAITLLPISVTAPVLRVLEGVYEITAKIIEMIMKFAPYAVACLLFNNTARFGLDLLQALAWFVVTVLVGLSLHMFGVYSLSI